jgi:hypothetical protein
LDKKLKCEGIRIVAGEGKLPCREFRECAGLTMGQAEDRVQVEVSSESEPQLLDYSGAYWPSSIVGQFYYAKILTARFSPVSDNFKGTGGH